MAEGINIEEIKQYNNTLKQYREKSVQLKAEIEYNTKEIETLCSELSSELGISVTPDNVEQIYNEQIERINSSLNSGKAILSKIANNEQSVQSQQAQPNNVSEYNTQVSTDTSVQQGSVPQQNYNNAGPVQPASLVPPQGIVPPPPVAGQVFNTENQMPTLFSI